MKTLIWIGVIFFAGLLFLPTSAGNPPRNLPLLIALFAVFLIYAAAMLIKRLALMHRTVRLAERHGFVVTRRILLPTGTCLFVKMAGETVCIRLIIRRRAYLRYHVESPTRIELYRTGGTVVKSSAGGAISRGAVVERCVGKKRFTAHKADRTVLLFDKYPNRMTDTVTRGDISTGECVTPDKIPVYDLAAFAAHLDSLKIHGGTL